MSQTDDGAPRATPQPTVPAQLSKPAPAPEPAPVVPAMPASPVAPAVPAAPAVLGAPSPQARSEATRLLCAGVYLDPVFRRRVVEELVEHEERPVAPSLGVDVLPVLAHALRCRKREVQTALWLVGGWLLFFALGLALSDSIPYAGLWAPAYGMACLFLWIARVAGGRDTGVYATGLRMPGLALARRWRHRLAAILRFGARWSIAVYWGFALYGLSQGAWTAVVFPLLLVGPVWAYRDWLDRVLRDELGRTPFRDGPAAELPPAYRGIGAAIGREQFSRLTVYDPFQPFVGYGTPYEPWSFAVELRRADTPEAKARYQPMTSRKAVELILPELAKLRESAAEGSRDRLRDLEVEQLAYVPPAPQRGDVHHDDQTVDGHLAGSINEGGEARRYFLRIRVGAWHEQVVVTILVRVHTQGGMLVLEVAPHVLTPVRPEFRAADALAARGAAGGLRNAVRAVLSGPTAAVACVVSALRALASVFRTWLADPRRLPAEGPAASVRELGSVSEVSLFQEMDVSRYVKTVQDRIAGGVTKALRATGHETGEFEQQIVNVTEGGVYIGSMSGGAVATGRGSAATHTEGSGT